uniref:SWIM-type domain-containing protein n=1 Tax=Macrostomum lignano TaxID=282301 RepID=A0A1I8HH74_9PLAT
MPRPKKSQALNSKNYRIKHAGTLKEKERLRSARRRKQQKSEATIKKEREQGRLRYQAWCARQKAAADAAVPEPDAQDAYKTKQATSRALNNVCNALSQVTRLPAYSSDWLATVVYCNPATPRCAVGLCDVCSSSDSHRIPNPDPEVLEDGVTFRFWQRNEQSQRMEQDARAVTVDTAHKLLLALLPKFIVHERTRVHQSAAYRDRKAALAEDEQIFHFDFSENYTCAHQDATQQAYWCQNQVTIFTVAVYRKSCSIMLALRFATPGQRVRFWSDGPASQFKNKFMFHFTELACREFELAELSWEFFATSHGKGAIDGLGGTLKRFAWCEVRTRNAIVQDAEDFRPRMMKFNAVGLQKQKELKEAFSKPGGKKLRKAELQRQCYPMPESLRHLEERMPAASLTASASVSASTSAASAASELEPSAATAATDSLAIAAQPPVLHQIAERLPAAMPPSATPPLPSLLQQPTAEAQPAATSDTSAESRLRPAPLPLLRASLPLTERLRDWLADD